MVQLPAKRRNEGEKEERGGDDFAGRRKEGEEEERGADGFTGRGPPTEKWRERSKRRSTLAVMKSQKKI